MTGAVMPKPPVAGATPLFGPNGMQGGVQGWTLPNGTTQAVQQTAQAQSQGAAQGTANVQDSRTLVTIPDPANPGGTKVVTQGWLAANSGSAGGQAASSAPADGAVSRGLRNNNPLNLTPLPGKGSWAGQVGTDGDFAKFSTMQAGLAAADRNLLAKGTLHGLTTLNGIIADPRNGWDPGNQAYVTTVSKDMGIDPNTPLPITDPAFRQRLLASMEKVEVGKFAGSNGSAVPVQGTTAAPATAPGVLGGTAGAADTAFAQGQGTDLSTRIGQLTDAREGSIQARTNALQAQAFASSHPMNPGTPLAVNAANWLRTVDPKILSAAGFDPNKISNYANDAGIFNRVTNQVTLSAAKTLLPSRYTERELKLIPPITGSLTTPNEAMGVAAGTQAAIAGRQQAQADFASSYNGPKTRQAFEAAWAASPQGQRSIFQDPEAWKERHLPLASPLWFIRQTENGALSLSVRRTPISSRCNRWLIPHHRCRMTRGSVSCAAQMARSRRSIMSFRIVERTLLRSEASSARSRKISPTIQARSPRRSISPRKALRMPLRQIPMRRHPIAPLSEERLSRRKAPLLNKPRLKNPRRPIAPSPMVRPRLAALR